MGDAVLTILMTVGPNRRSPQRTIAKAVVANISDLADVSDYLVVAVSDSGTAASMLIDQHRRSDGPWELLRRIADAYTTGDPDAPLPDELADLARLLVEEL